jgi:hypothetical protein
LEARRKAASHSDTDYSGTIFTAVLSTAINAREESHFEIGQIDDGDSFTPQIRYSMKYDGGN